MESESAEDMSAPLQSLWEKMKFFYEERDWTQFHSPKNLAMKILG